jgi:hypothetical protein
VGSDHVGSRTVNEPDHVAAVFTDRTRDPEITDTGRGTSGGHEAT